jgi:outer membrane protein assembly factor BamB
MKSLRSLRRGLSAAVAVFVFAAVLAVAVKGGRATNAAKVADQPFQAAPHTWPMFGGNIHRNFVNTTDKNLPSEWSTEEGNFKNIKWAQDLGSKAYGGPVIADGKIFVGTNNEHPRNPKIKGDKGILLCFRESDGKFLWQSVHDKLPAGLVNDWPKEGICSSPVVEGKRLYYVSNRCELVCADTEGFLDGKNDGVQDEKYKDPTDADIVWRLDMIKDLHVFPHNLATCSPLLLGDVLYLITSNGVDEEHINIPSPKAPSFLAVYKNTGKPLWQSNLPGDKIMHGQWSNPAYAEVNGKPQVIFPGGDGWLYGLEPKTGEVIWKFDGNPKSSVYKLGGSGTKSDFLATPVVHDNKVYIGVGQDPEHDEGVGHLWCIDITKQGDVSPVNDNFDPKAEVNKNSALVWHYGGPAPQGADRNYVFGRTLSTCSVHDGLVYVAELSGYFHCLDAKTGQKYWDHNVEAAVWSSPYWVDGKIYLGNDDGKIFVFKHGKTKGEPAVVDMNSKYVRATPVVANGVMYVIAETKTRLYAIAKKD